MLKNDRERKICEKYSARDRFGFVHCRECPLNVGNPANWDFRCKATHTYNRRTREWERDNPITEHVIERSELW